MSKNTFGSSLRLKNRMVSCVLHRKIQEMPKCAAITKLGNQCGNNASTDSRFCSDHQDESDRIRDAGGKDRDQVNTYGSEFLSTLEPREEERERTKAGSSGSGYGVTLILIAAIIFVLFLCFPFIEAWYYPYRLEGQWESSERGVLVVRNGVFTFKTEGYFGDSVVSGDATFSKVEDDNLERWAATILLVDQNGIKSEQTYYLRQAHDDTLYIYNYEGINSPKVNWIKTFD